MTGNCMSKQKNGLLVLLVLIVSMVSCQIAKKPVQKKIVRPNRWAISKRYGPNTVDSINNKYVAGAETADEKKKLLQNGILAIYNRDINFRTFSGKAKMHYASGGQKQEFSAHIRMQKDKAIWVTITAVGGVVNVARIYITPDSIFLVNYLQKEAYRMHISDANRLLPAPVDFNIMQNLIVGNILNRAGQLVDVSDYGGVYNLKVENKDLVQQVVFNKGDSTIRSLQMNTRDNIVQGLIQYNDYSVEKGRRFSENRVITVSNAGEPYYLDMNFNKVEFDEPVDMPFSIPKNYPVK